MNVIVTVSRGKERTYMKTFTIDDQNNITVFDTQAEAAATTIRAESQCRGTKGLKSGDISGHNSGKSWPPERFVAIWNSIPGVKPE